MSFALQRTFRRARPSRRWLSPSSLARTSQIALRLFARPHGSLAAFWRRQFHAGAARFRQSDRDRLLWRTRAVFALANVFHFFAHEFTGLRRWRLAFAFVFVRPFDG
ncbi:MAG TPA: hypothetical protein VFO30_04380 [Chthoniobacterales bacterium]|nr:hypothetical protein [Chthoniobacterales bacterium]